MDNCILRATQWKWPNIWLCAIVVRNLYSWNPSNAFMLGAVASIFKHLFLAFSVESGIFNELNFFHNWWIMFIFNWVQLIPFKLFERVVFPMTKRSCFKCCVPLAYNSHCQRPAQRLRRYNDDSKRQIILQSIKQQLNIYAVVYTNKKYFAYKTPCTIFCQCRVRVVYNYLWYSCIRRLFHYRSIVVMDGWESAREPRYGAGVS